MFFATDAHYDDAADRAVAAAVGFWHSGDTRPVRSFTAEVRGLAPYEPGAFYRRELPCLLAVLEVAQRSEVADLVIVDGHAWLREGEPGLGWHLWDALGRRVPVFGVAKAPYDGGCALEVLRGSSRRPLYVSAVGVEASVAADFVRKMDGPNRLPTLLAEVDALSRGLI